MLPAPGDVGVSSSMLQRLVILLAKDLLDLTEAFSSIRRPIFSSKSGPLDLGGMGEPVLLACVSGDFDLVGGFGDLEEVLVGFRMAGLSPGISVVLEAFALLANRLCIF